MMTRMHMDGVRQRAQGTIVLALLCLMERMGSYELNIVRCDADIRIETMSIRND